jgi:hypothetical protein
MTDREDRGNGRENKGKNKNKASTETDRKEVVTRLHGLPVVYHPYQFITVISYATSPQLLLKALQGRRFI